MPTALADTRRNWLRSRRMSCWLSAPRDRAQQTERTRRIGALMPLAEDDPEGQSRLRAFVQGLQQSGWTDGRNLRIDIRWGAGDADRARRYAPELVALAPDVMLAVGAPRSGAADRADAAHRRADAVG